MAGTAALAGWLLAMSSAAAGEAGLSVDNAWVRASLGASKVSAVYLTVTNRGAAADHLAGVATARAQHVMIHESVVENGVMKMRRVDAIVVPAGEAVRLEPGGLHVMLMGVSPRFEAGERVPVTLVFERAGKLKISVPVRRSPPE